MPHVRQGGQQVFSEDAQEASTQEGRGETRGAFISPADFYGVYHGHSTGHLQLIFDRLVSTRRAGGEDVRVIWLAGDSSLDNKYWLDGSGSQIKATNGMERVLRPATSVADVAAQLNSVIAADSNAAASATPTTHFVCINCSVEESTIGVRKRGAALLPQDAFVKANLQHGDVVVVSLGGNDVALRPTASTMLSMGWLTRCSCKKNITKGSAWGLQTMQSLVVGDLSAYLRVLLGNLATTTTATTTSASLFPQARQQKTSLVLPCVIYFPDENPHAPSWANVTLGAIGYNKDPTIVQSIINNLAHVASRVLTSEYLGLSAQQTKVEVVPLSSALDGKRTEDYVARVEPSVSGGRHMAELLWSTIKRNDTGGK